MEESLGVALELADERGVETITGPLSQIKIGLVMSETNLALFLLNILSRYLYIQFLCFFITTFDKAGASSSAAHSDIIRRIVKSFLCISRIILHLMFH